MARSIAAFGDLELMEKNKNGEITCAIIILDATVQFFTVNHAFRKLILPQRDNYSVHKRRT